MTHIKEKTNLAVGLLSALFITATTMFFESPVLAQTSQKKFEIFGDGLPAGAQMQNQDRVVREGGYSGTSKNYLYLDPSHSPAEMTGLSVPIRENPGPGEYRYITFRWIKWGGEEIGIRFGHDGANGIGQKYNYTYAAGKGDSIKNALMVSDKAPGNWVAVTRDLWKDFGSFTLTGVSFICPESRDAGFDAIFLGKSADVFEDAPRVIPTQVATAVSVKGDDDIPLSDASTFKSSDAEKSPVKAAVSDSLATGDESEQPQGAQVDWMAQIKAGGVWMYPLYLVGLVAILVALQRAITSRAGNIAPRRLRRAVRESLAIGDIDAALAACDKYPSTLAESLRYILKYRAAGMDVVTATAGDIAARDIREHLARIYPLSVTASLGPLLGLLGTIVGMIEAFGLVALYGDAGGPAMLSDSISKALITTAAGLIIAIPAIAVYFIIKKRIMTLASVIEVEVENAVTVLYLSEHNEEVKLITSNPEEHANTI